MSSSQNILGTGPIGRLMARFAIPSVTAMLVNTLYNIVDQIFIGRGVGYLGNGAANVVGLITMVTLSLSLWIGDGAAALYSLSLGEGKPERAAQSAGQALTLISAVSLGVMAVCLLFFDPILRLFGCTDVLLPYARDYGFLIVLGLPLIMIATSLNALIRADGSPRYAMVSMMVGAVINGCLDPLFIFGLGWGIRGAAAATLIGQAVTLALCARYLVRFQHIHLERGLFRLRWAAVRRILGLGISSLIDQVSFTLVMAVNNNLIVHYGALTAYGSEIPLTAYGVAMKVQEMVFTLVLGLAIGMQPIVGYNYGARQFSRVRKAYGLAIGVGTAVSALAALLFVLCPGPIIRLFGAQQDPLYYAFSQKFFQTYFLLYLFFGFQTITGVFFQAIGKPTKAAALSLSYQLAFKVLSALVLCALMGLDGVLWSGPVAEALAFVLAGLFVLRELKGMKAQEQAA